MIKYTIFDPTGNITALVETRVPNEDQPKVADEIMKAHPEVEQVGFVYFEPRRSTPVLLRMAGGEFCGNATMSAAALYAIRTGDEAPSIKVSVSGAPRALEVKLRRQEDNPNAFDAGLEMPEPVSIERKNLEIKGVAESLPVVDMGGISHIIIEEKRKLYSLKDNEVQAEQAVRAWCEQLSADCLGLMFIAGSNAASKSEKLSSRMTLVGSDLKLETELTPLVYVPGADTVFWENSCASGSSAVGMYLSDKYGAAIDVNIRQPGGTLRVKSELSKGGTWLYGSTKLETEGSV